MVTCNLVGRMGNQLFQIAATIAYALEHDLPFHIPAHTLNDSVWSPIIRHLENPNFDKYNRSITIHENGHHYTPIHFEEKFRGANIILNGYFQSDKYFIKYIDQVRELLGFETRPILSKDNHCVIHVRLGDYKKYPTKHPIVTKEYLNFAMDYMADRLVPCKFVVFSDEIEEAKKFFDPNDLDVSFENWGSEVADFQQMLRYQNFIISNSTFSLMAAILAHDSKVVAPKIWFGVDNSHLETKDIYPQNATII